MAPEATAMVPATTAKCNITMGNLKSLHTPTGMLLQIEVLVTFATFLLLFLVTFGSWRRRCNNSKFRLVIFTAYTLSTSVLTYALGLMYESPLRNEFFPIWAMFLMIAFGSADSISAYRLEDNEQWKSYNCQIVIKLIWLVLLLDLYIHDRFSAVSIATDSLVFVLALKSDERARAMMAASRHSLERNSKVVADYMSGEHKNEAEVDPVCMKGYTYLVRGEEEKPRGVSKFVRAQRFIKRCLGMEKAVLAQPASVYRMDVNKDELITVEKVWKCEGNLLRSTEGGGDPHNKLKDICLSFALFKLLRLRYAGYSLPQEAHQKTWNLILHGLLSQDDGYKRAFRVVETELVFLFDFFYTKYGVIFHPGQLHNKLLEFATVVIGIWAVTSLLQHHQKSYNDCKLDAFVTSVMIISFIVVELMQFFMMGFSEWAKVIWICEYVQKKSWQEKMWIERMIRVVCGVRLQKSWERKLRQYSFLESYWYKPPSLLNNKFMATYIDQTRVGQRQSRPIQLPEEVKQAVFHALKSNGGTKLVNGQASLIKNNVSEKLSWACLLETHTQIIMVWHIATSFCEHQLPLEGSDSPATRSFRVATSLSKYLAYLVAFAPRLLPDHPYAAEYVFDRVVIEAKEKFGKCKKMKRHVKKMEENRSGDSDRDERVINLGGRLGKQLAKDVNPKDTVWKILADFWVEMVLYVAPSDNARAHAEHLTRGGEFVTHLWALLSHAGIERAPPTNPASTSAPPT